MNNSFCESNTKFGRIANEKRSNKLKRDMGSQNLCTEQERCLYFSQISGSGEFLRNILQKRPVETRFW